MKTKNNQYYGQFGGQFIPEVLHTVFEELTNAFEAIKEDKEFWKEFHYELETFSCRPTPLMFAKNLTAHFNGPKIYVKREDLNHTGAHKLNNVVGQGLLAKRLGKTRIIAETGAGQHGIATATIAARLGLECMIYMGATDVERQRPNVFWMEKLGAKVVPVYSGGGVLKDAINEAMKDWVTNVEDTHYLLGTACGPAPFPEMVSMFQKIIGDEAHEQILKAEGKMPTAVYACVGGGSNAMGIFQGFFDTAPGSRPGAKTKLIAVEAGGLGVDNRNKHAARIAGGKGTVGVAQGYKTLFLQNKDGQLSDTHSISAGLDYVGVSPILADMAEKGEVRFIAATDAEVIAAHQLIVKKEGIIPALESTHAFAGFFKEIEKYNQDDIVIINQSGRGDKDIFTIADAYGDEKWKGFIREKARQYDKKC
jgi:tryptophan synthase beta chain